MPNQITDAELLNAIANDPFHTEMECHDTLVMPNIETIMDTLAAFSADEEPSQIWSL